MGVRNGLSMSDAKDAWLDDDGDEVLNLFEFQLGGDPFDSSIPTQIAVFPGENLSEVIDQASPGSVIRLTGGSYDLSYNQLSGPFRIMIQGGWDDNFLERDPCQNATVIKSVDDFEVTNFGIGNTDQLTFVAEDLIFEKEISFNSIISLVASENATAYLSILNGTFINSGFGTGGAIDLLVKDTANCYVTIANTLVADHLGDGVSISVSDGGYANTKVYHSTIANNLKDDATSLLGNGLIGLSLDEGILELDIQNTLLFGNADQDLNLLNGKTSMLDVQLGSSIVGKDSLKEIYLSNWKIFCLVPTHYLWILHWEIIPYLLIAQGSWLVGI